MTNLNESDIHDSEKDKEKLKPEETVIDLSEVEDIPGQANVKPPEVNQEEDLTVASDDEEGVGIFEENCKSLKEIKNCGSLLGSCWLYAE